MYLNAYLLLDFIDLVIGMKTNAPDIRMATISGPSMRGAVVSTKKQSKAQKRVRMMHWLWVSGFFIAKGLGS